MEFPASPQEKNDSNDQESAYEYRPIFSQQIHEITHFSYNPADAPPSALKALLKLTNSATSRDIGLNGPPLAADASERNKHLDTLNLYQELYFRDALVSAYLLWFKYPELTKSAVLTCLPFTGSIDNLSNKNRLDEQEKGKIPHQVRDPEHPRSRHQFDLRGRRYPYYGAIDTTQKNILAISRLSLDDAHEGLSFLDTEYRDLEGRPHAVIEGLGANIEWVLSRMSFNLEGLVESIHVNPRHHANQSWADSPDSFHHADGSLARHYPEKNLGVASVEVNAETYDALIAAIRIYEALEPQVEVNHRESLAERIQELKQKAVKLKRSILEHFWVENADMYGGYFARGTDRDSNGELHPLNIRSSDMGHLLLSDVLDDDDPKIESIIRNLFSPGMLAANGIRTLSSDSVRYNQDAYHNGSVWPWDTYIIALGLEKRGYHRLARELEDRIMNFYQSTKTLAEYGSGGDTLINSTEQVTVFDPGLHEEPIHQYSLYNVIQPPQEIQAWTVATILAIKMKRAQRFLHGVDSSETAIDARTHELELEILRSISTIE